MASPAYIEKHGILKSPEDLLNHNCLRLRFSPGESHWELEQKSSGTITDIHVQKYAVE